MNESPYLTAAEAAAYLRYANARALYKAIPLLNIPCRRRGGKTFLFVKAELDRWLEGERLRRVHGRQLRLAAASSGSPNTVERRGREC